MLKKISITVLASIVILPTLSQASSALDSLSTAFGTGEVFGQIGVNFRVNDANDNSNDGNLGYGYLELGYLTNEFNGAKLGASFIGVGEMWARKSYENSFSDSGEFRDKAMLRDFYLDYTIPGTKSLVLIGRKQFAGTPVTDGDVHQGIQLTVGDIENVTLYASVMNRWADNASTAYDLDGIDATWLDGDDIVSGASDTVISFMAEIEIVPEKFEVSPFLVHQSDVVTTYGGSADLDMPIQGGLVAGLEGVFAVYAEDTAASGDEDAYSYNLHGSLSYESWSFGVGYYVMSDDARVGLTAVGNDTFDPMEEGVYGGAQDDNTLYIDAEYVWGPVTVAAVYGDTDVDRSSEGAKEVDLYMVYAISETISTELMFVDVNDDDSSLDYQVYAGTINLSF